MRLLAPIVAATLTIAGPLALDAADAAERRGKQRATAERVEGYYRRPSTVDHRGLCQRDTGRPAVSLNLNQRCDREEFWARFNDYGGKRR
jgi:hypothetical protein